MTAEEHQIMVQRYIALATRMEDDALAQINVIRYNLREQKEILYKALLSPAS